MKNILYPQRINVKHNGGYPNLSGIFYPWKRISFGISLFFLISFYAGAQNVDSIAAKFPDKDAYHLAIEHRYDIRMVDGKPAVTHSIKEETLYLKDDVSSAQKETVHYSSFFGLKSLAANTYIPKKNGKYKRVPVKSFRDGVNESSWVFYDDSKQKVFYFYGVNKGVKTEVNYTLDVKLPQLMTAVSMQSYYPSEKILCSVSYPDDVEIGYVFTNLKEEDVTTQKTKEGNLNVITWTMKNVDGFEFEFDGPSPRFYIPQIHTFIKSYKTPQGREPVVGSVENLHKWYRSLIEGYDDETDGVDAMKEIVDSLTHDLKSEREKVDAIFKWVQSNIQYIAFEYELAGFVPRPAGKVCTKRFGDCKDMASILKDMLGIAGIKAYLTWIGTRDIPYNYDKVPTPSSDNHMIATWIDENNKPHFLDATDKHIPFGEVSDHIQGKQALVSFSDTEFKVYDVPIAPPSFTQFIDTCRLSISGSNIKGDANLLVTGYYKDDIGYRLSGEKREEREKYFRAILEKGTNKFHLDSIDIRNLKDKELPIEVDYKFTIPGFVSSYEDEMYVDMNLHKRIGKRIDDRRNVPFVYNFRDLHTVVLILDIPEGYKLESVPENFDGVTRDFHFTIDYVVKGRQVIYTLKLERSVLVMDKSYFTDWNKLLDGISDAFNETIVLKKI
ncbi:MAG: DUF3857 domain-containing protein [Bacteroidetes bacterium]|nr:DUF3857 domain-containing protein [Bacteroidota bacterium]